MTKLDYDTFDIVATLRMPGDDHLDGLAHEEFIGIFDSNVTFQEKFEAAKKSGVPAVDGVYTLLDVDKEYVVALKSDIRGVKASNYTGTPVLDIRRFSIFRPSTSAPGTLQKVCGSHAKIGQG